LESQFKSCEPSETTYVEQTVKFHIKTPRIQIDSDLDDWDRSLKFPFRHGDVEGVVSLCLDPDEYEMGYHSEDEQESFFPIACGGVIVYVNGRSENEFARPYFLEIAHKLAVEYMSKFVTYLATQLGQYWIDLGRMPELKLAHFLDQTKAKWIDGKNESSVLFDGGRDGETHQWAIISESEKSDFYYRADSLDEKHWNGFYLYVSDERFASDLTKTLIANAKRYYEMGDYGMAAVQAVTALDVSVEPFVEQRCKLRNISGRQFKESQRFLAEYLKVLLPLVLQENEIGRWIGIKYPGSVTKSEMPKWTGEVVLESCIVINSIRNAVAHRGKFEKTNIPKVHQGIEAAELLLEFMIENTEK